VLYVLAVAFVGGAAPAVFLKNPMLFPLGAVVLGIGGPIFYLKFMAAKARQGRWASSCLRRWEIIVRSLEGRPPGAHRHQTWWAAKMADPVGTEFGMAADEIAYGSTMQEAIGRMAERCQHPDVRPVRGYRAPAGAGPAANLTGLLKLNANTVARTPTRCA